jgi:hypothetical protein
MGSRRKSIDELALEKLSKTTNEAIGKIEVTIETGNAKVFYFRATRRECELKFRWGKIFAGIMGLVRLIF